MTNKSKNEWVSWTTLSERWRWKKCEREKARAREWKQSVFASYCQTAHTYTVRFVWCIKWVVRARTQQQLKQQHHFPEPFPRWRQTMPSFMCLSLALVLGKSCTIFYIIIIPPALPRQTFNTLNNGCRFVFKLTVETELNRFGVTTPKQSSSRKKRGQIKYVTSKNVVLKLSMKVTSLSKNKMTINAMYTVLSKRPRNALSTRNEFIDSVQTGWKRSIKSN